jgi:ABC-type antimicrobial peptide transport system permease subunit
MEMLAFFASVALALSVIGIYGLISYSTTQRVREFGIRRALGATQSGIYQIVIARSLWLALAGVIIGIAAAIALTRFVTSYLFHISPTDPLTFAAVSLLFLMVAACAGLGPAIRAANLDPARVLRYQ